MAEGIKEKIYETFRANYPDDISIKECAKKVKVDRDTASKYIAILEAEGKLKATKKVGNTKFFRFIPDVYTQAGDISERLTRFMEEGFALEILDEKEIETVKKAKEIINKKAK